MPGMMRMQAQIGASATVLLVERNDSLRRLLRELLTEAGYTVLEAGSRPAVIGHLREALRLDVIVTDTGLALPGWEVVQEASRLRPGVPVVRLIESVADACPVYGEDASTMLLVQKPFAITELLDVLDDLLPRSHAGPSRRRRLSVGSNPNSQDPGRRRSIGAP